MKALDEAWVHFAGVCVSVFVWRTVEVSCPTSLPLCLNGSREEVCCMSLALNSRVHPMGCPPLYASKVKLCETLRMLWLVYPSKHHKGVEGASFQVFFQYYITSWVPVSEMVKSISNQHLLHVPPLWILSVNLQPYNFSIKSPPLRTQYYFFSSFCCSLSHSTH